MLFANIEDFSDTIEVVVFPETLTATQLVWKESNPVALRGTISIKDGTPKLLCEKAKNLSEV